MYAAASTFASIPGASDTVISPFTGGSAAASAISSSAAASVVESERRYSALRNM